MRALGRRGFYIARRNGPHFIFSHCELGGSVPVPKHEPTIANGTFANINRLVREITGEDLDI
jgi:predicted RNA binding protein YcfA (HicA-like mRNA interferase family)